MSFPTKIAGNIERTVESINREKPNLVPTERDVVETTAKTITKAIPSGQVLEFNAAVDFIAGKTGIDPRLVAEALSVAIKGKDFAVVNNERGVYLRRN